MLKWISAALALICIATFVWMHLDFRPTECTQMAGWRMHPSGDHRRDDSALGVNLPMERPDNSERPTPEAVARALRRLLFAAGLLLGLAFALICYAEMFSLLQFD
jgi:hypothetical protein